MPTKILIVDDNEFMRWAIRDLLAKNRPGWVVCGEAGNGEEAVRVAALHKPDVVILDESMPVMTGLEAAKRIAKLRPRSRVLLLTAFEPKDIALAQEAAGVPVYPCVDKARTSYDLVPAVEALLVGSPKALAAAAAD